MRLSQAFTRNTCNKCMALSNADNRYASLLLSILIHFLNGDIKAMVIYSDVRCLCSFQHKIYCNGGLIRCSCYSDFRLCTMTSKIYVFEIRCIFIRCICCFHLIGIWRCEIVRYAFKFFSIFFVRLHGDI